LHVLFGKAETKTKWKLLYRFVEEEKENFTQSHNEQMKVQQKTKKYEF
jgi:hypothetical protein